MKKIVVLLCILLLSFPLATFSKMLIPMGHPVGIRLQLNEVMLTKDMILGNNVFVEAGTTIKKVENQNISSIKMLQKLANETDQFNVTFHNRSDEIVVTKQQYEQLLMNVTEYTEGIGTLTYIDPTNLQYGALGHQIVDNITKKAPSFSNGLMYNVDVKSVKKSKPGLPGYKVATFQSKSIGLVDKNLVYGVFGKWESSHTDSLHTPIEIMQSSDIKLGNAELWTSINESTVDRFKIKIDSVTDENFTFSILDEKLLQSTGGIIQGMSGSPIIQDNQFVGAVTHMYVENPKKGIGILLLEMLEKR